MQGHGKHSQHSSSTPSKDTASTRTGSLEYYRSSLRDNSLMLKNAGFLTTSGSISEDDVEIVPAVATESSTLSATRATHFPRLEPVIEETDTNEKQQPCPQDLPLRNSTPLPADTASDIIAELRDSPDSLPAEISEVAIVDSMPKSPDSGDSYEVIVNKNADNNDLETDYILSLIPLIRSNFSLKTIRKMTTLKQSVVLLSFNYCSTIHITFEKYMHDMNEKQNDCFTCK